MGDTADQPFLDWSKPARADKNEFDLMLLCVEAGMSVEHAFKRVSKEIGLQSPELAEELTLTTAELSFLEDRTRAYDNLGRRTGLDNVKAVMQALIQSERHGTSVGTSLRVMAEEGREARMMEREEGCGASAKTHRSTDPLHSAGTVYRHHLAIIRLLDELFVRVTVRAERKKGPIRPLPYGALWSLVSRPVASHRFCWVRSARM
jgi:hypothetical protein